MSIHVERSGAGPEVLLVHAGGCDARMWEPLAQRLGDRFTLIAPDLRAHGHTPAAAEPYSDAADLIELLDGLGLRRVPVVGASFGGRVALELATLAPDRVTALVLLAAALPDHRWSAELEAYFEQEDALVASGDLEAAAALGVRTWVADAAVAPLAAEMARDALAAQRDAPDVAIDLAIDLAAIAVPTLAVSGGRDHADFAAIADRIAAEVAGAQRATVPDAGHLIALERPDATTALLAPLLASARAGA